MYDVVIIGAGPAGLFARLGLMQDCKTAIIDAGVDLKEKRCMIEETGKCCFCKPVCHILGGFGGAQFFEGSKLSRYPAGSGLIPFCGSVKRAEELYDLVDKKLKEYGNIQRDFPDKKVINMWGERFGSVGIEMKYYNAQKVSKYQMNTVATQIKETLLNEGVDIFLREQVVDIAHDGDGFKIYTQKREYSTRRIIFAVGRVGARQLTKFSDKLGIEYENEAQEIEIGVRVEAPYTVFSEIDNIHNDLKLKVKLSNGEELRTFCQDYKGYITKCVYNMQGDKAISSLDGHIIGTDATGGKMSDVVNLAVHHRYKIDYDIDKIYDVISKINRNGKPIVQSMKNFVNSTDGDNSFTSKFSMPDVIEGNINAFLPPRTSELLKKFIMKIDLVLPGFAEDGNTVYAPSFEMGWKKYRLNSQFETNVDGIFICGDVTGHFRGAMQAMISGMLVAERVVQNI